LHPAAGPVDNGVSRVQSLHPGPPTGCNHCGNGVHLLPERGTAAAPEPSLEPSREPPATRAAAHDPGAAAVVGQPEAGGGVEFFSRLWPSWPLTDLRRRLAPTVAAALATGWDPPALAAFVGANTC
jgi:hypothetical protein